MRTQEVFALSNLDLVPGKYEGKCSLTAVSALTSCIS